MVEEIDNISEGTAAILVRNKDLKNDREFVKYLHEEGFEKWSKSKGHFDGVDWIYVNINSKVYAYGMPGIAVTKAFGNHAVSINEFKMIYSIYKKYENKSVLFMK